VAAAAVLVALLAGTWLASLSAPSGPNEPISVLVADFVNLDG
jgi:hypothetical protein